jgi:hypothetical protein
MATAPRELPHSDAARIDARALLARLAPSLPPPLHRALATRGRASQVGVHRGGAVYRTTGRDPQPRRAEHAPIQ